MNTTMRTTLNRTIILLALPAMLLFSCGQTDSKPEGWEDSTEPETEEMIEDTEYTEEAEVLTVTVTAESMAYSPARITAYPGQAIEITLMNNGQEPHNIEFELPSGEVGLEENIQPGESAMLSFTAPTEVGSYTFYCPVEDHHEKNMEGLLIVEQ